MAARLNGLGVSFSATVLDDSPRAKGCSIAGAKATGLAAQNVEGTSLQIVTIFDVRPNWYHKNSGTAVENCVIANNHSTALVAQVVFLSASDGARDFLFFNNAFENKKLTGAYNSYTALFRQLANPESHFVMVYNSFSAQTPWMRGDQSFTLDAWRLIANNSFYEISWAGTQTGGNKVRNNHLQAFATSGTIGIGTFAGGTPEQLLRSSATGDFTARSALFTTRRGSIITFNRTGAQGPPLDVAGSETYWKFLPSCQRDHPEGAYNSGHSTGNTAGV